MLPTMPKMTMIAGYACDKSPSCLVLKMEVQFSLSYKLMQILYRKYGTVRYESNKSKLKLTLPH